LNSHKPLLFIDIQGIEKDYGTSFENIDEAVLIRELIKFLIS
jgi:hypothetical protein